MVVTFRGESQLIREHMKEKEEEQIPGLYRSPDAGDLADSRSVHAWLLPRSSCDLCARANSTCSSNGLPQPEEQPEISDITLKNLGELFSPRRP